MVLCLPRALPQALDHSQLRGALVHKVRWSAAGRICARRARNAACAASRGSRSSA